MIPPGRPVYGKRSVAEVGAGQRKMTSFALGPGWASPVGDRRTGRARRSPWLLGVKPGLGLLVGDVDQAVESEVDVEQVGVEQG